MSSNRSLATLQISVAALQASTAALMMVARSGHGGGLFRFLGLGSEPKTELVSDNSTGPKITDYPVANMRNQINDLTIASGQDQLAYYVPTPEELQRMKPLQAVQFGESFNDAFYGGKNPDVLRQAGPQHLHID